MAARFVFNQFQGVNAGYPSFYQVIDGGSGQCAGQVYFDVVMGRWSFYLTEPRHAHIGGSDITQISTFIASLAVPPASNYQPIV